MMQHKFSEEQVQKGNLILNQKEKAIGEIKDQFIEFLLSECQEGFEEVMHTDVVLVHPKNRSGMLVNAFDAHQNAAKIKHAGANLAELHNAMCIEMHPDPIKRQARSDFNHGSWLPINPKIDFPLQFSDRVAMVFH